MMETLRLRAMVLASMFGAATAAGAYLMIPLSPVPITLQSLFLNLAAAFLGGSWAAFSQIIYILLGVLGLPVFAGGKAGLGTLLGPTGGYLFGFILAGFVAGKFIEIKKNPGLPWMIFSMAIGLLLIYALGILHLMAVARIPLEKALLLGVLPFLPGDFLKILAASLLARRLRPHLPWGEKE
jgi:biotin transport system substrate-specific component